MKKQHTKALLVAANNIAEHSNILNSNILICFALPAYISLNEIPEANMIKPEGRGIWWNYTSETKKEAKEIRLTAIALMLTMPPEFVDHSLTTLKTEKP